MKYLLSILITFCFVLTTSAQGIEFFNGTWNEALELAKKEGKLIFVDAYAKWCGPCKRMAATAFKDEEVGAFFNKNFINLKIDAEEGEGVTFRKKYPVSAYPTLFFIDDKGEVVHKVVGGQDVKGLLQSGQIALNKVDHSRDFAKEYEKGNRDPELIYNYVKALNKSNKSSLSVSNEYLRSQQDLTTPFNLRFILEAAVAADSRIFDLLIQYQKEIGIQEGLHAVRERILYACENTARKAIEFQSLELLQEAKAKMKQHYPEKYHSFAAQMDMAYFKSVRDAKNFSKACSDYVKNVANGNPKELHKLAEEIQNHFSKDTDCMKLAEKYAKEAAEKANLYQYYITYASILNVNGKKKPALEAANKALTLAKESGAQAEAEVRHFIKMLEG